MSKLISVKEAASLVNDGDTLMVGGFYTIGTPEEIIDEVLNMGKKDLVIINNDGGNPDSALGRLLYSGNVSKFYASWCGYLRELPKMMEENKIKLELNPQGTLIERIRSGGFGLGGVLTPTGLGTLVEEEYADKKIVLDNGEWLYHSPLVGDITFVEAYEADEAGNLIFRRTQRNFSDTMCFAAKTVVASVVQPIKKAGELDPDSIMVPGVVVDYLVQKGE